MKWNGGKRGYERNPKLANVSQINTKYKKKKIMNIYPTIAMKPRNPLNIIIHTSNYDYLLNKGHCECHPIQKINEINTMRYLGVVLDNSLKWKEHAKELTKKIRSFIPLFYDLRSVVDRKTLDMVFTTLVQSRIKYGILV